MKITTDQHWIRFGEPSQSSSFTGDLSGKYLFFSPDQEVLTDLAILEIKNHRFEVAKVSVDNRSGDYVCCLYWHDDSRKVELARRHADRSDLKYRWWKSNADTRAGKYSSQFTDGYHEPSDFQHMVDPSVDPDMDHHDWIDTFGDLT